ncbi:MAG: heme biosynthesis HemY N-terminal domain-containing protein [Leptothrix sp. (in: b-proteobacteria)]
MRWVVWLLLLFVVAFVSATTLGANDGIVSVYWAPWRVDLSLNFFLLLILGAAAATYFLVGAVSSLVGLPERARRWRLTRRDRAAQLALRESIGLLFAGRYGRAHKSAQRALEVQALTDELGADVEFGALAHLLAASSLHHLQDRQHRDAELAHAMSLLADQKVPTPVAEGARLLAAEWAIDDRDPERALDLLSQLTAGVARRTQAMRLRLQASRLARQPLEALKTARLLAKHQGFAPVAAQGILRSLAIDLIDTARDADQLRRIWLQLDSADRRDPVVAAHAATLASRLDAITDGRGWLRPHWERIQQLGERERGAVLSAFVSVLPGMPADWLPMLENAVALQPQDAPLAHAVGCAMAERKLWGRARRLLETAAATATADAAIRRDAWRRLGLIAEQEDDVPLAQRCFRECARIA